jgi:hypothetical protein
MPALGMPATDTQELHCTHQGIKFDATTSMTLISPSRGQPAGLNPGVAHAPTQIQPESASSARCNEYVGVSRGSRSSVFMPRAP